jgi:hypothetical protein
MAYLTSRITHLWKQGITGRLVVSMVALLMLSMIARVILWFVPVNIRAPQDTEEWTESQAEEVVTAVLGNRLSKLNLLDDDPDQIVMVIEWKLREVRSSQVLLETGYNDVYVISRALWEGKFRDYRYSFRGQLPVTNSIGDTSMQTVLEIEMSPKTFAEFVARPSNRENLPEMADTYWHHPMLDD